MDDLCGDDPADPDDHTVLFSRGNEAVRIVGTALQAHEGLEADDLTGLRRDLRLVYDAEAVVITGVVQGLDDIVLLEDALMHRRVEEYRRMLAVALRFRQRLIRLGEKLVYETVLPGRRRHSDTAGDGQMLLLVDVRLIQDVPEVGQHFAAVLPDFICKQDGELVAAVTGNEALVLHRDEAETTGHLLQDIIAGAVAEGVVQRFEVIDIDQHEGMGATLLEHLLHVRVGMAPVRELRHRIMLIHILQLVSGVGKFSGLPALLFIRDLENDEPDEETAHDVGTRQDDRLIAPKVAQRLIDEFSVLREDIGIQSMLLQDIEVEDIVADVFIVHRHGIGRRTVQDVNDGTRGFFTCRFVVEVMTADEAEAETADRGAEHRYRTVLCDEFRACRGIVDRAIRILEGIHIKYDGSVADAFELLNQLVRIEHRGIDVLKLIIRKIIFDFLELLEVPETGIGFVIDGDDRICIRKKLPGRFERTLQIVLFDVAGDIMVVHCATCAVEVIDAHENHRAALEEGIAIAETELECRIIGENDGVEGVLVPILVEQTVIDILQIPLCRVVTCIHELFGQGDSRVPVEDLLDTLFLFRHGDVAPAIGAEEENICARKRRLLHGGSRRIRRIGRAVEVLDEHHEATEDQADREGTQDDVNMFS